MLFLVAYALLFRFALSDGNCAGSCIMRYMVYEFRLSIFR